MPVVVRWIRPVPHSQHVKHSSLWFRRLVVSPLAPLLEMPLWVTHRTFPPWNQHLYPICGRLDDMSEFSHLNPKYDLYLNLTMSFFWLNLSKLRAFDLHNSLNVSNFILKVQFGAFHAQNLSVIV